MKNHLKTWTLRLTIMTLLVVSVLLVIILNPTLTYAHKTEHPPFTIYHQNALDPQFQLLLHQVSAQLTKSELYDSAFSIDICLNEGASCYITIIHIHVKDKTSYGKS